MRLPEFYWLISGKRFTEACKDVHRFVDQIIDHTLHSQKKRNRYCGGFEWIDGLVLSVQCEVGNEGVRQMNEYY
jgi:hypothetical protein